MAKLLEEFGKWFLNGGLIVFATFVIQPFRDEKFEVVDFLALSALVSLLAFGGLLLYLSLQLGYYVLYLGSESLKGKLKSKGVRVVHYLLKLVNQVFEFEVGKRTHDYVYRPAPHLIARRTNTEGLNYTPCIKPHGKPAPENVTPLAQLLMVGFGNGSTNIPEPGLHLASDTRKGQAGGKNQKKKASKKPHFSSLLI